MLLDEFLELCWVLGPAHDKDHNITYISQPTQITPPAEAEHICPALTKLFTGSYRRVLTLSGRESYLDVRI